MRFGYKIKYWKFCVNFIAHKKSMKVMKSYGLDLLGFTFVNEPMLCLETAEIWFKGIGRGSKPFFAS